MDNIVGILNAKDYFRLQDKSRESIMKKAVKPAYFVPEKVNADVLFRNMKHTRNNLAVVLDEYGGMTGIITMNDLVEQLVGELGDDQIGKEPRMKIEQIDSKTWKISGDASLSEVSETLGVVLPQEDYGTFNGLIFNALGAIPQDGSTAEVETSGLIIKIKEVRDHQVEMAIVGLIDS